MRDLSTVFLFALSKDGRTIRFMLEVIGIRSIEAADEQYLMRKAYEAGYAGSTSATTFEMAMEQGTCDRMFKGWGRVGDIGLIALSPDGDRIGAVWSRQSEGLKGYEDGIEQEVYIAVDPLAQGQRVGSRLLPALLGDLREAGGDVAVLFVFANNEPALRLYRGCGFEVAEERTNKNKRTYYRMECRVREAGRQLVC